MLIKIDAAGLEWRTIVWLSNDQVGIAELNEGQDVHSNNEKAFNLPERLIAKRYLFRVIYRGSGYAFSMDNDFSHISSDPDYWDELNRKFFLKYKGIDQKHQEWARTVVAGRPIISPLGREWLIPMKKKEYYNRISKTSVFKDEIPWTTLTNHPVQGTGADIVMIARILIHRRMKELGLKALLCSTVHDDIKVDCPKEEVFEVAKIAEQAYNDVPKNIERMWGIKVPIAFPGEVKVGPNLKDMVKLHEYASTSN